MSTYNEVFNDWKDTIIDIIDEVIDYDFDGDFTTDTDAIQEVVGERLWETIDGCQDVIYTYHAKEISKVIGIYDAFDTWESCTGERFDNWSMVAFANIYDMIYNDIDFEALINQAKEKQNEEV